MELPGRTYSSTGTPRYGYQGQEYDDELGQSHFELRQLDTRLGRWLNPDPMGQYHSPYMAMGNDPINRIDPNGGYDWQSDYVNQWHPTGGPQYNIDGLPISATAASMYIGSPSTVGLGSYHDYAPPPVVGPGNGADYDPTVFGNGGVTLPVTDVEDVHKRGWRNTRAGQTIEWLQGHLDEAEGMSDAEIQGAVTAQLGQAYMRQVLTHSASFKHMLNSRRIPTALKAKFMEQRVMNALGDYSLVTTEALLGVLPIGIASGLKIAGKVTQRVAQGTNTVYRGIDAGGKVRYVGITSRAPAVRFGEHLGSATNKAMLDYRVVPGATNLSRTAARVWEQNLINQYGLGKNGGQLFNKINSISPSKWHLHGIY